VCRKFFFILIYPKVYFFHELTQTAVRHSVTQQTKMSSCRVQYAKVYACNQFTAEHSWKQNLVKLKGVNKRVKKLYGALCRRESRRIWGVGALIWPKKIGDRYFLSRLFFLCKFSVSFLCNLNVYEVHHTHLREMNNSSLLCILELGRSRCRYFRSLSVSVFFPTFIIRHVLNNREPSFPSLFVPGHPRVSKRSTTFVLLDCSCMDFRAE